ncbi:MAG: hypothetical protein ACJAV5_000712 [Vicingaceae bacterium]
MLLLLSIFTFQLSFILACTCGGKTSFCDINFTQPTDHVFIGKFIRHDSLFSEFELIEKHRGVETRDTILIWDNPAPTNSCVDGFEKNTRFLGKVGDSILIILPKIDSVNTWGVLGDYYRPLGVCSSPYLPINNGLIIGNLTETDLYTIPPDNYRTDSVTVQSFKQLYNANGRAFDCDLFVGLPPNDKTESFFKIFPNPAEQSFAILSEYNVTEARIINITRTINQNYIKPS